MARATSTRATYDRMAEPVVDRVPETRVVMAERAAGTSTRVPDWALRIACIRLALAGSIVLLTATLVGCYALWVRAGCLAFLPAVSDFGLPLGGPMRFLLRVGLGITAILLVVGSVGVGIVRLELLCAAAVREGASSFRRSTIVTTAAALLCASGVGTLALFPWHEAFVGHAIASFMAFGGGLRFMLGNAALLRRIAVLDPGTNFVRISLPRALSASALTAAVVALGKFGESFWHVVSKFTLSGPSHVDLALHCSNGWGSGLELAWVCEWLLVILLATSFVSAWADVTAFERLRSGSAWLLEAKPTTKGE